MKARGMLNYQQYTVHVKKDLTNRIRWGKKIQSDSDHDGWMKTKRKMKKEQ